MKLFRKSKKRSADHGDGELRTPLTSRRVLGAVVLAVSWTVFGVLNGLFFALDAPFPLFDNKEPVDSLWMNQSRAEYEAFIASQQLVDATNASRRSWHFEPGKLGPFDPNTADSATLCRLGMPSWMAHNLLRYREAGGRFREPDALRKLYGITEADFQILRPYIRIAPEFAARRRDSTNWQHDSIGRWHDSLRQHVPSLLLPVDSSAHAPRIAKLEPGQRVDINRADTTELKRIPGVGSYIALRITERREALGGYHHLGQLYEIGLDTTALAPWVDIDLTTIRRINFNRASYSELTRHPYINHYQARAIIETRRRRGRLTTLKVFALLDEFSGDALTRLEPYVCFDD